MGYPSANEHGNTRGGRLETDDEGYHASLDEDDDTSSASFVDVTGPSDTNDEDGRASPVSVDWEADTESNAFSMPPSALPFSIAHELIEGAHEAKAKLHQREHSTASTQTLTNNFNTNNYKEYDGGAATPKEVDAAPRRSNTSDPRRSNTSDFDRSTILADLLIASAPRLRHIASFPSRPSAETSASRTQLVTPASEQRHPGKPGVRLARLQRPYEPNIPEEEDGGDWGQDRPGEATETTEEGAAGGGDDGHLQGLALILLVIGLSMVVFLISIDRTIITTAIPYITGEFKSTSDIGWYGSSYLLTACAFQPVFGRVFTLFNVKWSYLLSMFVFELGSIISGWAPTSAVLIIGRAIAGFGSAGILTGSFVIVATAVPLKVRPIYTAVVGLMFGVGATIGPLIGGVFTDLLTWRWCFWINLPVGAVTIIVMFVVFHPRPRTGPKRTVIDRLVDLDLIGNLILLVSSVMLFLALEYTLTGASWGSAKVIGLLCAAVVTAVVFVTWLWWKQDAALLPPAIVRQRTVAASCLMAFFTYGALLIQTYFLPIWFQAILGYSAIQSGVAMIPYFVANALFSLFSGVFVSVVGYFAPPAILGSAIGTVGCGAITLFHPGMATGMWIGIEILASAGFGMSVQQGFTAVQTVLQKDDLAVGTAAVVASQSLGGAMFISVGNSVFQNRLQALAAGADMPGLDVRAVVEAGATAFRKVVTPEQLPLVLDLYDKALHSVFYVAIPLGGLAFLSCCFLEWRSVKPPPKPSEGAEKA
ncbi:Uu.00g030490.m01.CDS01 [Anthostomella pinea]|uniref:Uu.00g030490.m01.CDS01 n=1 Tax=Anthostomella pinea TaxID=933095 RepID=A0AAI8V8B3_9PEZI|nr:Uu.00g030490.m01.CDS01 [Anthostomella pinea]